MQAAQPHTQRPKRPPWRWWTRLQRISKVPASERTRFYPASSTLPLIEGPCPRRISRNGPSRSRSLASSFSCAAMTRQSFTARQFPSMVIRERDLRGTQGELEMRFGVFTSLTLQTWPGVLDLWQHLEATGWDIACVSDHFMPNTQDREGPVLESWSTLAALAALVPRMRVGTIVLGNTYRHPAVVAKMAAQVDIISGGRLLLGVGSGWQQNEHEAYGIPFYTMRERLERLDEACEVIRSMWKERRTTFEGRYYQLTDAPLDPKPVQTPQTELMIGGGGERVTLRIVAKHADHWNIWGGPGVLARKGKILDDHCSTLGRDPKTLKRSANMALLITDKKNEVDQLADTIAKRMGRHAADARDTCLAGTPDQIREQLQQLQSARVDTLFIPSMFRPVDELRRDLDRFITEIAPEFR